MANESSALLVPVLCPCKNDLHVEIRQVISSVLRPLGFSATFRDCENVEDALAGAQSTKGVFYDKIPFPVCMPIISAGAQISDSEEFKPVPRAFAPVNYSTPNEREVVLLVEGSVALGPELIGASQVPPDRVIRFSSATLEDALGSLVATFVSIADLLRANLERYQLPETRERALDYDSAEKRVYVYDNGYGLIEMRFTINEEAAEKVRDGPDFVFSHTVDLKPPPVGASKSKFDEKLDRIRVKSIRELFQQPREAFAALPFGLPAPNVRWEPAKTDAAGSSRKTLLVHVSLPTRKTGRHVARTLSYGIAWSAKDLFNIQQDSSSFLCAHNYRRVTYTMCFMRPTLAHDWPFALGPRLERFGPYQNNLGYIDTEGVGDESFHYLEYPWTERKLPVGSVLRASWRLAPKSDRNERRNEHPASHRGGKR